MSRADKYPFRVVKWDNNNFDEKYEWSEVGSRSKREGADSLVRQLGRMAGTKGLSSPVKIQQRDPIFGWFDVVIFPEGWRP